MSVIPQREFDTDEVRELVRSMVEAYRFLTIPIERPARYANKERIEDAIATLGLALAPYQESIDEMLVQDERDQREFEIEMARENTGRRFPQ